MFRDRGVEIKTPEQIALMRGAGLVVGETLELLRAGGRARASRPASSTRLAEEHIRAARRDAVFLATTAFPATICTSVNDEVVHGIPGDRVARATATGLASTAARSSTAGTATPRSPSRSATSPAEAASS